MGGNNDCRSHAHVVGLPCIQEHRDAKSAEIPATWPENDPDASASIEFAPSNRSSNSANLDLYQDLLRRHVAHPLETNAVKALLRLGSGSYDRKNGPSRMARRLRTHRINRLGNSSGMLVLGWPMSCLIYRNRHKGATNEDDGTSCLVQ
jgi:hypothetical protein